MAKPIRWLFAKPAVTALASDPETSRRLEHTQPFVMWGRPFDGVPPAWDAVPVIAFRSFGAIKDALESGGTPPSVKGVMYDFERWQFTPVEEQRNPAPYVKRAAELVHAHGLLFLTAPAVNIVRVMAPAQSRDRMDDTYLRLRVAADAARFADVIDIQAQRYERDASLYAAFVHAAAKQARQANPKVMVLAGLSTEPIGQRVSAD
ncbi:MAG: hypothetical protein JOZ17_14870, partial [Acetobacteraceae bacterium]|nr:hypothetical protein [Acetobacteraceae bacterium]